MRFDENAQLDTSQVQDVRGRRVPGGAKTIGGGLGTLLLLLLAVFLGPKLGLSPDDVANPPVEGEGGSELAQKCSSGAEANRSEDCRIVAVVNSVQDYWSNQFSRSGVEYRTARTQLFTDATNTGCGSATSAVGPFYCPPDQKVYLDLTFFDELESRFGAEGGPFAQAYVVAHEYGHHVQNLLGTMDRVGGDREGPQSASVRLELQADCFAGVWANHATTTPDPDTGRPLIVQLTQADIHQALDAAAAVGDDRIQESTQGQVNPERWTHGSAEQREKWFSTGFQTGDPNACDTFSGGV
ncbi:MAG TPA: neutral zinc metallopeptidase [Actinomycetes bacterium]|nr:neutral zinc metallopeptidase [Actinomycetes bacterium]